MTSNLNCPMSYTVYKFQPEIGEFSACCDAKPYHFDSELFEELKEDYFEKHPKLIDRKVSLKNNIKHGDCVQCWKKEDQGLRSMRQDLGPLYTSFLKNTSLTEYDSYPERIELWMNSTCNLGCFMCHLGNSNTLRKIWHTDRDTFGNDGIGFDSYLSNSVYKKGSYEKQFNQYMMDFIIKTINRTDTYMLSIAYLGGEPTLHSEMYEHADIFIEAGREAINRGKRLQIEITTNGTSKAKLNERFYRMFEKYKSAGWSVRIMLSQDGAEQFSQVRHGADFETIRNNFNTWISRGSPVDMVTSFSVISAFSIPYLDVLANYISESVYKNKCETKIVDIHFNTLISPRWMQVRYTPLKYVKTSAETLKIFKNLGKRIRVNMVLLENIYSTLKNDITLEDVKYHFENVKYVDSVYKKTYKDWSFFETFPHLVEYASDYGIEI